MAETDILKQLVDGTLKLCDAPGCSHTFTPTTGKRYCGEDDCTKGARLCSGPWCTVRVMRVSNGRPGGSPHVFCSEECQERHTRKLPKAADAERGVVLRDAIEQMAGMNGARLGPRFQAVQDAVKGEDNTRLYEALVEAGAACLETAARRGPA